MPSSIVELNCVSFTDNKYSMACDLCEDIKI